MIACIEKTDIPILIKYLRKLSENVQIIISTCSPLVLNEMMGNEISIITNDDKVGIKSINLNMVPRYSIMREIYQNGEIWLSYCDGINEEPLIKGLSRK